MSDDQVESVTVAREMGAYDGYTAAMAGQSASSYPRLSEMGSDETRSAYTTYFQQRYQQTMAAKKSTGSSDPTKVAVALSDEVSKMGGKTVAQWENELNIPSWEIAQAVAQNFNADELSFERMLATGDAYSKVQKDATLPPKIASFITQWRTSYAAIRGQVGFTPTTAVAEVRRARAAMNALATQISKVLEATPVAPPVKTTFNPPPAPPAPPPIAAKSKLPAVGILAALGAIGAGVWYAFFRKKDNKPEPKKLGMGAGAAR